MNNLLLLALLICCFNLCAQDSTAPNQPSPTVAQPTDVQQDVIVMTNGNIFKGKITQTDIETIDFVGHDGNIYQFHKKDILRIISEPISGNNQLNSYVAPIRVIEKTTIVRQKKYSGLAFLFSFILPGGGQYYNDDYVTGGIMTGVYVGSSILFCIGAANIPYGNTTTAAGLIIIGGTMAFGTWLWSIIDAPIRTKQYNRSLRNTSLKIVPDVQCNQTLMPGNLTSDLSVGLKLNLTY